MAHISRIINYQICVKTIDEFPAKLKDYAGREIKSSDIKSISCDARIDKICFFVSLWNSSNNPFNTNHAL